MAALNNEHCISCAPCTDTQTSLVRMNNGITVKEFGNAEIDRNSVSSNFETVRMNESTDPVLDIVINNVVCSFNLKCHLNLKYIALNGYNVEYRRENGMVTMKLRNPCTTASIWSSGKITCTGATSDADAKKASRRFARLIQQLGFNVKFTNFRIVNVLGTCMMPFAIKISQFSAMHRSCASYEPELHPGVTYKIKELKATLKIFSTGNITITAPSIRNVQQAVEHIFPLVHQFRKEKVKSFPVRAVQELDFQSEGNHSDEEIYSCTTGTEDIRWN